MESKKFEYQIQKETAMIRAAIFDLGLSQTDIARAIKRSRPTVCQVLRETRKADPTLTEIKSFLASEILKRKKKSCNR